MLKRLGISSKMYEFLYIEEQRWKIADICLQFKAAPCSGSPVYFFHTPGIYSIVHSIMYHVSFCAAACQH